MRSDDLEFLIAQYADGTLDSEQRSEVEAVLRRSESARQLLESYRSMERVLSTQASPHVRWDRLEDRISRQIAVVNLSTESASISEEVEEQLSRLAEGSSSAAESRLIEARLSADPQARLMLSEYASLDRIFDAIRTQPLPAVRWHKLNDHLAQTLGLREAEKSQRIATPRRIKSGEETGVLARIGNWFRAPQRLAMAACVLIAGAVGIRLMSSNSSTPTPNPGPATVAPIASPTDSMAVKTPSVLEVKGPSLGIPNAPSPDQNATANSIKVGPPASGMPRELNGPDNQNGEATANRGASLLIAPDKPDGQDRDAKASREGWPFPH